MIQVSATTIEVLMTLWRQNQFWHREGHYAARCNSGGMAHLADLVPDQPDAFCFADAAAEAIKQSDCNYFFTGEFRQRRERAQGS